MINKLTITTTLLLNICFISCVKTNEQKARNSSYTIAKNITNSVLKKTIPKVCNPLIKTYWHQYQPFNKYASEIIKKEKTLAGCGIIALAQLLNYHKHFGNNKKYFFGSIGGYLNSVNSNFPNSENKKYISEFIADISKNKYLKTYIESNQSIYVYMNSIPIFLEKNGYNVYTDNKIDFYKIKKSLSEGNPIIAYGKLKGGKKTQTHVWIIDGYIDNGEKDQKLHMNWGFGVNYQNGTYGDGWVDLCKFGFVEYRNISFSENVKLHFVYKKSRLLYH